MNIKDYFSFTRGEKRGVVFLLFIIIVIIIGIQFIDNFKTHEHIDFSEFEDAINELEQSQQESSSSDKNILDLFKFNPNTISNQEWEKLGFLDWQIKTINNYKSKGGSWKTKNDVRKIYGLDSSHFVQLEPYILLPKKSHLKYKSSSKEENIKPSYFDFDPNTISKNEWKKLGFKSWQIETIFNYKSKGGSWKTKNDVKKIYGLEGHDYIKLEPYILLPNEKENTRSSKSKKDYTAMVNVNTANANDLKQLKGINSEKYAALFIKYRNALGGFIRKEQLKEVWNLTEETYNGFEHQIELGKVKPILIDINNATIKTLTKHPYINWKTGNAIIKYRKANGKYSTIEDIKKIHLINDETYTKISPYLLVK